MRAIYLVVLTIVVLLQGCMPLIEVNIVSRNIADAGDGTEDGYASSSSHLDKEEDSLKC